VLDLCTALCSAYERSASISLDPSSVRALQGHKVAYPTPLEAVLRAERALLPNLKACGALQRASFVWTVDPHARLLDFL